MLKRLLVGVLLVSALPVSAHAGSWSLNTWAKSGGGNIAVRGGAGQTSVNGSVFKSYTTTSENPNNVIPVVVTANPGYSISKLTVNGIAVSSPVSPYSTTLSGPATQSVYATFRATIISVAASAGAGGSISPTSVASFRPETPFF